MCGNPRPLLFITHGRKHIPVLGIVEDGAEKHRYYYTFELHDLTTGDCESEVTFKVMGSDGEESLTKKLRLDGKYVFYIIRILRKPANIYGIRFKTSALKRV